MAPSDRLARLRSGLVIPAHPLALTPARTLDERRQRALTRYYIDAGAGGVAVGVHTTQFQIRKPGIALLRPVLELAAHTVAEWKPRRAGDFVKVAGVVGATRQALAEAKLAADLGYDAALLSLGALARASDDELVAHARAVADVIPVMGFYLQPAVGGRALSYRFCAGSWRSSASSRSRWRPSTATRRSTWSARLPSRAGPARWDSTPGMTTTSWET